MPSKSQENLAGGGLTVLRSASGRYAAKRITVGKDGQVKIISFSKEAHFTVETLPVNSFDLIWPLNSVNLSTTI